MRPCVFGVFSVLTSVCSVCDQCRVAHVVVSKDEFIRLVLVPPWVRTHAPRAYTQHVTLVSHRSRAVRIGARELHLLEPSGHHAPRPASPVSFTTRCSAVSTRDFPKATKSARRTWRKGNSDENTLARWYNLDPQVRFNLAKRTIGVLISPS